MQAEEDEEEEPGRRAGDELGLVEEREVLAARVGPAVDAKEDEADAAPSGLEEVERQQHEAEADPADQGEGKDGSVSGHIN